MIAIDFQREFRYALIARCQYGVNVERQLVEYQLVLNFRLILEIICKFIEIIEELITI